MSSLFWVLVKVGSNKFNEGVGEAGGSGAGGSGVLVKGGTNEDEQEGNCTS